MTSPHDSVREDVEFLKASDLVRPELKERVAGFVYDVKTGLLNPVV
jgi:carbonic anhydrase